MGLDCQLFTNIANFLKGLNPTKSTLILIFTPKVGNIYHHMKPTQHKDDLIQRMEFQKVSLSCQLCLLFLPTYYQDETFDSVISIEHSDAHFKHVIHLGSFIRVLV